MKVSSPCVCVLLKIELHRPQERNKILVKTGFQLSDFGVFYIQGVTECAVEIQGRGELL